MPNSKLSFSQFDLRVIATGIFNRDKFFVVKLLNLFKEKKYLPKGTIVLEILPLYTIDQEKGTFLKKHLQNYNNVHSLLVPEKIADEIEKTWDKSLKKNYLMSFVKYEMDGTKFKTDQKTFFFSYVLIPGSTIIISPNSDLTSYVPTKMSLNPSILKIPQKSIRRLQCTSVVCLDDFLWKTCHLMDQSQTEKVILNQSQPENLSINQSRIEKVVAEQYIEENMSRKMLPLFTEEL